MQAKAATPRQQFDIPPPLYFARKQIVKRLFHIVLYFFFFFNTMSFKNEFLLLYQLQVLVKSQAYSEYFILRKFLIHKPSKALKILLNGALILNFSWKKKL